MICMYGWNGCEACSFVSTIELHMLRSFALHLRHYCELSCPPHPKASFPFLPYHSPDRASGLAPFGSYQFTSLSNTPPPLHLSGKYLFDPYVFYSTIMLTPTQHGRYAYQ